MCDRINEAGKFEGEPCYAQELHDVVMSGGADVTMDDDGEVTDYIVIDDEFKKRHDFAPVEDEENAVYAISCWTDNSGFFHTNELTRAEYDAELKSYWEED